MPISLGAVTGGPEKLTSVEVCKELMTMFKKERGEHKKPFLNVVFHFHGSLLQPEYKGLRTGRFSSKEQGFMIQVAVPEDISYSESENRVSEFIITAVKDAVELSRKRWKKHSIIYPFDAASKSINNVSKLANVKFNT